MTAEIEIKTECDCSSKTCSDQPRPRFIMIEKSNYNVFCEDLEKAIINGYQPASGLKTTAIINGDQTDVSGRIFYSMLLEDEAYITEYAFAGGVTNLEDLLLKGLGADSE